MTVKNQLKKLKENWLLVAVVVVFMAYLLVGGDVGTYSSFGGDYDRGYGGAMYEMEMADEAYGAPMMAKSSYSRGIAPMPGADFAPEVEERKITKSASMSTEVEKGTFHSEQAKLHAIVTSSDSFILHENVNKYGHAKRQYYQGSYNIKVETGKYDSVITQLKEIGEIQSFNENKDDITGRYTDTSVELEVERERLQRYEEMYEEAEEMEDKINLNDRIFNQERRIKYLEKSLSGMDTKVEYSTIHVTLREKQSDYIDVVFIKFSELVREFVDSINSVLSLVFWAVPYAVLVTVLWIVYRFVKRRTTKKK